MKVQLIISVDEDLWLLFCF